MPPLPHLQAAAFSTQHVGHCASAPFFGSHAWALNDTEAEADDTLSSAKYMGWVRDAMGRCIDKDREAKFVSVWADAGCAALRDSSLRAAAPHPCRCHPCRRHCV